MPDSGARLTRSRVERELYGLPFYLKPLALLYNKPDYAFVSKCLKLSRVTLFFDFAVTKLALLLTCDGHWLDLPSAGAGSSN